MKKIIFVIGNVGSGRKLIFKNLYNTCKIISNNAVTACPIGNFQLTDQTNHIDTNWSDYCVNQITTHLDIFTEKDYYIFTGSTICMYIDILIKRYPDAGVYLIRKLDEDFIEPATLELTKFNATASEIKDFNKAVTDSINRVVDEYQLEWKYVNSPAFTDSLIPNFIEEESNLRIQIATYNI